MSLKIKTGTVEGTGAAIAVECGFTPSFVGIFNVDGDALGFWTEDLADAEVFKLLTGGTLALMASAGITPTDYADSAMGFTIGADTDLNVTSETIVWLAIGEA